MNKTFDEYWEEFISYLLKQCVRINPTFPENKQEFKASINMLWNRIRPGVCLTTVIIAYLLIIPLLILIAESHIINRVTSFVISNGLIYTLISLIFLVCLITFLVQWEQLKLFVKWDRFKSFVKDNIVLLSLILLFICFYHYWESLIGNYIISKFLCNFESNWLIDSIFILGVIACFFLSYHERKKQINQKTILYCLIAITYWIYYRCSQNLCGLKTNSYYLSLESLSFTDLIKYIDLVPIYAICTLYSPLLGKITNCILNTIHNKSNDAQGFERDVPIDSSKDNYMRHVQAEEATNQLLKTDTADGSFTYGIDAPWGAGKTSFMNMMKEYINQNENIIIDFNPWLYSNEKDLVSVFFDELSKNLKKYDKSLAKNIIDYSKILSVFNTNETKIIASLLNLFHHNVTFQEKKSQIEGSLKKINKKIFVFIDDLDRLYADELLEMMKLIRNVSDFPNMYFIAAYDKKYLIQCLNTKMPTKGTDFIEKVFTQEFHLPPLPQINTSLDLYNYISPLLSEKEQIILSNYITENNYDNSLPFISNLRETKRIANSIKSNYRFNKLYFKDHKIIGFVILEYFKIKYPLAFTFFEGNWEKIIDTQEINNRTILTLYFGDNNDMNLKINFINYIDINRKDLCINDEDIRSIKRILTLLFGNNGFVDDLDVLSHYFNPTLY